MEEIHDRHHVKEHWTSLQSVCRIAALNLTVFEHQEHQGHCKHREKRVDKITFSSGRHMQRKKHLKHDQEHSCCLEIDRAF